MCTIAPAVLLLALVSSGPPTPSEPLQREDTPGTRLQRVAGTQPLFDPNTGYRYDSPDGKGPILFQSLAILEYLDEIHPRPPLLPQAPRDRARVRGLALIVACDAHPLIVPRVRNYLERELKLDEAARLKWIRHWFAEAFEALEVLLSRDPQTGRYCHEEQITTADICLASHVIGGEFFKMDAAPYPTVKRIFDACMKEKAFADAHPLKQPGAPKAVAH